MKKPSSQDIIIFKIHRKRSAYERWRKKINNDKHYNKQDKDELPIIGSNLLYFIMKMSNLFKYKRNYKNKIKIKIPKNFSIIDNYIESLSTIYTFLSEVSRYKAVDILSFNYSLLETFDLAAETLLDIIVKELAKYSKIAIFQGTLPKNQNSLRFIYSMGIIRELKNLSKNPPDKFRSISIFREGNLDSHIITKGIQLTHENIVAIDFTKYIDKCLSSTGYMLSRDGRSQIGQYVCEILDNIKEHSNRDDWRIAGFLDTSSEELTCEIVIVNIGLTIAESFYENTDLINEYEMNKYVSSHKSMFLTEENLITLFALQGNVSSKNKESISRGQGTIQYLSFFIELNKLLSELDPSINFPTMILVSGHTYIKLDNKINKFKDDINGWIIPLNNQGSLEFPPDKHYFLKTGELNFPGTLISIKFDLPHRMLQDVSYGTAKKTNTVHNI